MPPGPPVTSAPRFFIGRSLAPADALEAGGKPASDT